MTVSQKQAADTLLSASYFVPATSFFGISAITSSPVEQNRLTLLYTVPISIVANMGAAVLSTVIGLIDLLAAALFAGRAFFAQGKPEDSAYWMNQAKKIALVGTLLMVGSPAVAVVNVVAPFFIRNSAMAYMKGNPEFIAAHAGKGLSSVQIEAIRTFLSGEKQAGQSETIAVRPGHKHTATAPATYPFQTSVPSLPVQPITSLGGGFTSGAHPDPVVGAALGSPLFPFNREADSAFTAPSAHTVSASLALATSFSHVLPGEGAEAHRQAASLPLAPQGGGPLTVDTLPSSLGARSPSSEGSSTSSGVIV